MTDLDTLETLAGKATGFWDMPETRFSRKEESFYDEGENYININLKDWKKYGEFIWLHEFHHCFFMGTGQWDYEKDDVWRARCESDDLYYYLPMERAANLFAYEICIREGYTIPDYLTELDGYF